MNQLKGIAIALSIGLGGCTHNLEVKNLEEYATALTLGQAVERPQIAIMPFSGTPDSLFYHNAVVSRLSMDPGVGAIRTDYTTKLADLGVFEPDVVVSVRPSVTYRSSGWNFLINWPGFLIFTPIWNGYVYRADIMTQLGIYDGDGNPVDQLEVPITYNIRHADGDRTIFTGLTWLEVSSLALFGGIYNAFTFDRDVIGPLQIQIKDNYAEHIISRAQQRISTQADVFRRVRERREAESSPDVPAASPVEGPDGSDD